MRQLHIFGFRIVDWGNPGETIGLETCSIAHPCAIWDREHLSEIDYQEVDEFDYEQAGDQSFPHRGQVARSGVGHAVARPTLGGTTKTGFRSIGRTGTANRRSSTG